MPYPEVVKELDDFSVEWVRSMRKENELEQGLDCKCNRENG
jgi:hypothetical protein